MLLQIMPNLSSVPVILKRMTKNGNLGSTKATNGFWRTLCYTELEMGQCTPRGAIICLRTLYTYFLCGNLHASVPFCVS